MLRDSNPSPTICPRAGVVELVDTWDLKSHGALPRAGSSPASGMAATAFPDVAIPSWFFSLRNAVKHFHQVTTPEGRCQLLERNVSAAIALLQGIL